MKNYPWDDDQNTSTLHDHAVYRTLRAQRIDFSRCLLTLSLNVMFREMKKRLCSTSHFLYRRTKEVRVKYLSTIFISTLRNPCFDERNAVKSDDDGKTFFTRYPNRENWSSFQNLSLMPFRAAIKCYENTDDVVDFITNVWWSRKWVNYHPSSFSHDPFIHFWQMKRSTDPMWMNNIVSHHLMVVLVLLVTSTRKIVYDRKIKSQICF